MSPPTPQPRRFGDDSTDLLLVPLLGALGLLLFAGLGVRIWTAIAALLGGNPPPSLDLDSARSVLWQLPRTLDDPAQAWPEPARSALPGPAAMWTALLLLLGLLTLLAWGVTRIVGAVRRGRAPDPVARTRPRGPVRIPPRRDPHGSTNAPGLAAEPDVRELAVRGPTPGRIGLGWAYGHRLASQPEHSVLVVGATRSGKTSRFAMPALLDWDGPAVVLSAKTDLVHATRTARLDRGEVWVYDPTGISGLPDAGWSPLAASVDWAGALRTAAAMSRLSGTTAGLGGSSHWEKVAAQLLAPLLLAASVGGLDMADVVQWATTKQADLPRRLLYGLGEPGQSALESLQANLALEPRAQDSAFSTVRTVLDAYTDPGVVQRSRSWQIRPDQLFDGRQRTLYLVATPADQQRLAPVFLALLDTVLRQAFETAARTRARTGAPIAGRPRLLLLLDEAANIAPLPDLATLASTAGGEGVQLLTVYQDLSQLRHRYQEQWGSIASNHVVKVVLPGVTDPDTLRYVSSVIGDTPFPAESVTQGRRGERSTTTHTQHRPIVGERELRQIPTGQGLVLYGARPPIRVSLPDPPPRPPAITPTAPATTSEENR